MKDHNCLQKFGLALKGTAKRHWGKVAAVVGLALTQGQALALTNTYATAIALTGDIEDAFDTGATIGLGIIAFLLALGFVLKGIRVAHRG